MNFDQLSDRFKVFPGMPTYTNAYIKGQKSILDVQQKKKSQERSSKVCIGTFTDLASVLDWWQSNENRSIPREYFKIVLGRAFKI